MIKFKVTFLLILALLLLVAPVNGAYADEFKEHYASIRASEANVRTGPSARYPIKWVFKRKGWPVRVVATFEQWQKIVDRDGQEGWMHEVLLTRKRHAIVKGGDIIKGYRLPIPTASPVVMYEENLVVELQQCKSGWCKVAASGHEAWLEEKFLWGVKAGELYK